MGGGGWRRVEEGGGGWRRVGAENSGRTLAPSGQPVPTGDLVSVPQYKWLMNSQPSTLNMNRGQSQLTYHHL